jgi:hypothetical protein
MDTVRGRTVAGYSKKLFASGCNRIDTGPVYLAERAREPGPPGERFMDFTLLIPITAFICIVMAIKIVVENRLRRRLAETNASEDLIKSMLLADEQSRRLSALKWGLVMTLLGLAFGLISALQLDSDNPGTWGLLIGAAGVGMLAYHGIVNRVR